MRRRSRREPNTSEATGKTGREIPVNQPRPLSPSYLQEPVVPRSATEPRTSEPRVSERVPVSVPTGIAASVPESVARSAEDMSRVRNGRRPERRRSEARKSDGRKPEQVAPEAAAPQRRMEVETQPESPAASNAGDTPSSQEPKGFVVLTIGLPGSGKTTWYKRRGVTPLSSDMLRTILFDDITEQRYQGLVFATLRSLLRARLIAKMPWNYVDATNLSAHERRQWIKMAQSFGYEVQAVFFDVPLEVCLERNAQRDRPVSEEAMQRMAEKLKAPDFDEGFAKITVVRVKQS